MNSLNSRLRRLEERARGGNCLECGLPPGGARPIVIYDEEYPDRWFPDDPDECCSKCGRPLWTVIEVVYEGAEEEKEGGA